MRCTIDSHITSILGELGEDASRDGLQETPTRVARALRELTCGYTVDVDNLLKTFDGEGANEMVVVRNIPFHSLCEHHMLPFFGVAHVAYLPGERIVGLSKLARLVDAYARRLQVQERLTKQVADTLDRVLAPKGVGVVIEARHFCMEMRGVRQQGSTTRTTALRGVFEYDRTRAEFLAAI